MWKLHAKMTLGVFVACILALACWSLARGRPVEWRVILLISAIAVAIFAARSYFPLRKEHARLLRKRELVREAWQQLVDDMARMSPADLSILVAIFQQGERNAVCGTMQGSANHRLYVQMADLGLMKPIRMETTRDAHAAFTSVRYVLTSEGYNSLGALLETVARRRIAFASLLRPIGFGSRES